MNGIEERISSVSRLIYSYCASRTGNQFDAEDMAQDILLALSRSLPDLRDEKAFYGFMWAVAGNVSRQWYRKKYRHECECALDESAVRHEAYAPDDSGDIALLRRELALMSARLRRATVMYYIENRSCSDIAAAMGITESNVKYLLFRSRRIIREGMNMERVNGELSYNPGRIALRFWSWGLRDTDYDLRTRPISQNILLACYNDRLTAEEISLEMGVGLPYMENELQRLTELELLARDGRRYTANIPIISCELHAELLRAANAAHRSIVESITADIPRLMPAVRALGFQNADMPEACLRWQLATKILHRGIIDMHMDRKAMLTPYARFGGESCVWAVEEGAERSSIGIANLQLDAGRIRFCDTPHLGGYLHHSFLRDMRAANVFIAIAAGSTAGFGDTDNVIAAELTRSGFVRVSEKGIHVNAPVFTAEQYARYEELIDSTARAVCAGARRAHTALTGVLRNHLPGHLRRLAETMSYLIMLNIAINEPLDILVDNGFLTCAPSPKIAATAHIALT